VTVSCKANAYSAESGTIRFLNFTGQLPTPEPTPRPTLRASGHGGGDDDGHGPFYYTVPGWAFGTAGAGLAVLVACALGLAIHRLRVRGGCDHLNLEEELWGVRLSLRSSTNGSLCPPSPFPPSFP
jgi:hypothetical protein